MKRLGRLIKNFKKYKHILELNQAKDLRPSLLFLRENLIDNCYRLQKDFKKNNNIKSLDDLKDYSRIIEIIDEIEDDAFLENVGFKFIDSGEYKGVVEIQDELFYQWEVDALPDRKLRRNKKLIQKSIILEKREWQELKNLLKKVIDDLNL